MSETKSVTREIHHYVVVPLMASKGPVDAIISGLVKMGYTVSPLEAKRNPVLSRDGNITSIISLVLKKTIVDDGVKHTREIAFDAIQQVLKASDARYYMIWVGDPNTMFTWALGNVAAPVAKTIPTETPISAKGSEGLN